MLAVAQVVIVILVAGALWWAFEPPSRSKEPDRHREVPGAGHDLRRRSAIASHHPRAGGGTRPDMTRPGDRFTASAEPSCWAVHTTADCRSARQGLQQG